MVRMLITRPEPDAAISAVHLRALDIEPVTFPLMERAGLDVSLPEPEGFAAIALTSGNALRALLARNAIAPYRRIKVFAVGDRTAEEARFHGFEDVVSASGDFADLVEAIARSGIKGPILHPAGRHLAGDLGKSLAAFGIMVVTARIYEMRPVPEIAEEIVGQLAGGQIDAALFYSRRTAEIFVDLVGGRLPAETHRRLGVLCLSEAVAAPLINARFVRIGLADYPSGEAMMSLALSFARDNNLSA